MFRNFILVSQHTIGRSGTASSMTAFIGKESIGLGAIEARYQTIVSAIELPQF